MVKKPKRKKNNSQIGNEGDQLLTPKDVARKLAVSQAWVRDHASGRRKPYLPHIRLGDRRGQLRFRPSDLDAFLQLNARHNAAQ